MAVTRAALNGYYKVQYGEKNKPLPSFAIVQRALPFKQRAKTGKSFNEPVFTRRAHGVTFATTTAGTVYALNAARSIQSAESSISGSEIIMREQIAYGAIAAAEGGDGLAFGSSFDEAVLGIYESHSFYLEANALYGRTSIGAVETNSAGDAATNKLIKITKQSWAPGLWAQCENALLDNYDAPGGTKLNTNGPITVRTLSDVDNRTLSLDFTAAADATACVATSVFVFVTADQEVMSGFDKIITNTGSLFGIDASLNAVWKGNKHDCGGVNLTMAAVLAAQTKAVVRGGMGPMVVWTNPYVWQDLADDQSALRRYGDSQTTYKNGAEAIEFSGTGGRITFEQHPMVKCGEGFMLQLKHWIRGGESDLVDKLNDASNDDFFHEVPGFSGSEMRNYSSQFVFCRRPAAMVKLFNITPRQLA